MQIKRKIITALLLVASISPIAAQQTISDKLVKYYTPNSWWLSFRYDHYLKTGSYFFLENNNRFNLEPAFGEGFFFNSLYRTYVWAGYEHKAHEKWYLGLSEKYVIMRGREDWYTKINITHRGKLSKLAFVKELSLEHFRHPKSDNPNVLVFNEGRVSFAPALVKTFAIQDRPLYVLLSYRAAVLFDWTNDGYSSYDKRNIDFTRLRFEVSHFVTKNFMVSMYAIRDTWYSYQLAQYDASNNEIVPEARVNKVTPTFGVTLNYVFNKPEDGYLPAFPGK